MMLLPTYITDGYTHRIRRFSSTLKRFVLRKLDILSAAYRLDDLREPPESV